MIQLLGFAPDADPSTPGVITDCENLIPYQNGMEGAPTPVTATSVPVLAADCLGAAVVTNLAGTRRVLAGAATKLYELSGGAWSDVSRVSAYTGTADTRWMFTQFGNATLAANRADTIQRSTGTTFADISGAPKAEIVFSVGPQVMALNVNDGTEKPDGWHCCAIYDETLWTPSLTTQAANGRLVATAGALTAGARLGEYAIAYKEKSIYLGQYVGTPVVWDWIQVPGGEAGCVGKEALCDIGGAHFFVGQDNFWIFDGTRPVPLADNVLRQWFYDNSSAQYRYRTKCVFDRQNNRVWVFYPANGSSVCNEAIVYHIASKRWGRATVTVQAALNYIAAGLIFDTMSNAGATYDALPSISYDSQYWMAGGQALSAFNDSRQLQMFTGASASSSFTTGDGGDDEAVSLLTQVRLRHAAGYAPTTAAVQTFSRMTSGGSLEPGPNGAMNDGKFDVLKSARWHRARFDFTGPVRVTQIDARMQAEGLR
jgi:hypothetical protein